MAAMTGDGVGDVHLRLHIGLRQVHIHDCGSERAPVLDRSLDDHKDHLGGRQDGE